VARGATARELRETAKSKGFQTLADAAIRRVLEGDSTLTEVLRAVDLTLMQRTL
jgi:general secretion pathway protein E/type IV pilus assembly protein PilB